MQSQHSSKANSNSLSGSSTTTPTIKEIAQQHLAFLQFLQESNPNYETIKIKLNTLNKLPANTRLLKHNNQNILDIISESNHLSLEEKIFLLSKLNTLNYNFSYDNLMYFMARSIRNVSSLNELNESFRLLTINNIFVAEGFSVHTRDFVYYLQEVARLQILELEYTTAKNSMVTHIASSDKIISNSNTDMFYSSCLPHQKIRNLIHSKNFKEAKKIITIEHIQLDRDLEKNDLPYLPSFAISAKGKLENYIKVRKTKGNYYFGGLFQQLYGSYSKDQKIAAAQALIDALDSGSFISIAKSIDKQHQGALVCGELGDIIEEIQNMRQPVRHSR